ncbi:MAG: LON peptidase substrate-binding domain-containing protein [Kouleothrix sp.]
MPDDLPILFDFPTSPEARVANGQSGERELPIVPLINTVLFPHMLTPLFVGRERSVAAVEEAMEGDRTILAIAQREQDVEDVGPGDLFTIGVEAHIQRVLKMPDGSTSIVVQGRQRMRVRDFTAERPMLRAAATPIYSEEEKSLAVEAMMRAVLSLFEKVVKLSRTLPDDSYIMAMNVDEPGWLADLIASTLPLDVPRRQEILETIDPEERLRRLSIMLTQELDVLELESRIHRRCRRGRQIAARVLPARADEGHPARARPGRPATARACRPARARDCRRMPEKCSSRRSASLSAWRPCRRLRPSIASSAPTSTGCSTCRGPSRPTTRTI